MGGNTGLGATARWGVEAIVGVGGGGNSGGGGGGVVSTSKSPVFEDEKSKASDEKSVKRKIA